MSFEHKLLLAIANNVGTPVYVYDKDRIVAQINRLKTAFKNLPYQLHYAMKANENPEILKIIKENHLGVDAVSVNEIKHALSLGFDKNQIIFTPSCPSEADLAFAFSHDIHVHIGAVEYFDFILKSFPHKAVGLRINPDTKIAGNQKIATAHYNSKFGIPVTQLNLIKKYLNAGLKVDSLHLHTGSDVKTWHDLARSAEVLMDFSKHFPDLKYLDLGSGFKVKYHPSDTEIDLQAYAGFLQKSLKSFNRDIQLKFEPGKFIVSNAGVLLVKVNVVKQGYNKKFIGVNSGFHHLIRPMYYDAYHQIVNLSNTSVPTQTYDVVGVLCEEDTFAYNRELSPVQKDDILMIENAGAYGYVMASQYNLQSLPAQVLIEGNDYRQI